MSAYTDKLREQALRAYTDKLREQALHDPKIQKAAERVLRHRNALDKAVLDLEEKLEAKGFSPQEATSFALDCQC